VVGAGTSVAVVFRPAGRPAGDPGRRTGWPHSRPPAPSRSPQRVDPAFFRGDRLPERSWPERPCPLLCLRTALDALITWAEVCQEPPVSTTVPRPHANGLTHS